jgi:hypothetical protein
MALQLDISNTPLGVGFPQAYARVTTATFSRQRNNQPHAAMIDVVIYATSTPTDDTKEVDFRRYHTTMNELLMEAGELPLNKIYNWLAKQPDFAGCVSV